MPNDPVGLRDIVLHTRSNGCRRISELHKAYDPLCNQYPILFPFGTDGCSLQLKISSGHKIPELQCYGFHFSIKPDNFIMWTRKLLEQFIVNAYAKIECGLLQYLRHQQGKLRADS
ncbi:DNA helicase [Elysia marginata]|uniref:DNA helicase n=1 Tax=Elysia marginata TaxID=1093978 RepID=A0AAV4GY94_9GAST|nr:DNA helicase [Elysia marginata]